MQTAENEQGKKTAIKLSFDVRPLYRVTFPLAYKNEIIPAGSLHRLEKINPGSMKRLKARGTVVEVRPPPLRVLPGWQRRASRLEKAGVSDAVQFLGVDAFQVAEYMRVKPETVEKWKADIKRWLEAPTGRK